MIRGLKNEPSFQCYRMSTPGRRISPATGRQRLVSARPLLVALDFLEVGVDDVVVYRLRVIGRLLLAGGLLSLHVGVHLFAQLLRCGRQGFHLGVDRGLVAFLQRVFQVLDGGFDAFLFGSFELVAVLGQRLAGGVHQRVGLVARLSQLGNTVIFLGVGLG